MRCNVFPDKRPLLPTERNGFRILLLSNEDTETNTGRRDGGQGPELEARATFYRMFAPSLKRCMHLGAKEHARALQCGQNWQPDLRFTQSLTFL